MAFIAHMELNSTQMFFADDIIKKYHTFKSFRNSLYQDIISIKHTQEKLLLHYMQSVTAKLIQVSMIKRKRQSCMEKNIKTQSAIISKLRSPHFLMNVNIERY